MRILLVRLRQIGDVVFTTPAVRALREHFPSAHFAYLVEPAAAPVVRGNPHLDEVIVAERFGGLSQLIHDISLARRLRASHYDIAIDFHGGPRASLLTWLSGARMRVGYDVSGRGWMYTKRIARPRELRPRHSVVNQWDLLAAFDIPPPDRSAFPVEMAVDTAAAARVGERLSQAGLASDAQLVVVHVSAGNPFRRWPPEHFVTVVRELAEHRGWYVIVTSGPSERKAAERVIARARASLGEGQREHVLSCGDFALDELRALLDRAVLYIGGDSGPLHVAATTRVPIVGLYGPTLPVRSEPWRDSSAASVAVEVQDLPCRPCDQRVCAPGDFRCLTRIGPDQVLGAVKRALSCSGNPA